MHDPSDKMAQVLVQIILSFYTLVQCSLHIFVN